MSASRTILAGLVMAGLAAAVPAAAEEFPSRPIRVIVPFAAGGPVDAAARVMTTELSKRLPQALVVENRPGATAAIGVGVVAAAKPDGYTLFFSSVSSLTKTLIKDFPYDFMRDFEPVGSVFTVAYGLFVNAEVPARTLDEFIAYAKSRPGVLNYGAQISSGILAMEMLKAKAGLDIVPIAYRGSAPAQTALLGNEIQVIFDSPGIHVGQVQAGKERALVATGPKRFPVLPDVPTADEAGVPFLKATLTGGFWAPVGVDKAAVAKLEPLIEEVVRLPEVGQRLTAIGMDATPASAQRMREVVQAEMRFWDEAAAVAKFQPQ